MAASRNGARGVGVVFVGEVVSWGRIWFDSGSGEMGWGNVCVCVFFGETTRLKKKNTPRRGRLGSAAPELPGLGRGLQRRFVCGWVGVGGVAFCVRHAI